MLHIWVFIRSLPDSCLTLVNTYNRKARVTKCLAGLFARKLVNYEYIMKTCFFKYIVIFFAPPPKKKKKNQRKNSDSFLISIKYIDCWYPLQPPHRDVSNDMHNLCFGAKIRKKRILPKTPVFLYKSGG